MKISINEVCKKLEALEVSNVTLTTTRENLAQEYVVFSVHLNGGNVFNFYSKVLKDNYGLDMMSFGGETVFLCVEDSEKIYDSFLVLQRKVLQLENHRRDLRLKEEYHLFLQLP